MEYKNSELIIYSTPSGNISDYDEILQHLISEIKSIRIVLSKRVNTTIIQLYWNIGKYITEKKLIEGYGKSVVERLASDLKSEFPDYGFTPRYLWEMKRFYETYFNADEKLKQLVSELPSLIQWKLKLLCRILCIRLQSPNINSIYQINRCSS